MNFPLAFGIVGPGRSSADGQKIGDAIRNGVFGLPSRMVSMKPCSAGANVRSFSESRFTTLMPTFRLNTSAASSRIVRATN